MINYVGNPWFWVPVVAGFFLSVIYILTAYYTHREITYPCLISAGRFGGPLYAMVGTNIGGMLIPILPIVAIEGVKNNAQSVSLLGATMILAMIGLIISIFVSTSVAKLKTTIDGQEKVKVKSTIWVALHGTIFALTIAAVITIFVAVFTSPIVGPKKELAPAPPTTQTQEKPNAKQ